MLQEVKELQKRAVGELLQKLEGRKRELTFRAPTGSGKTHMMADLMNRVLEQHGDVVFLVSTLSKGGLAEQNYESFCRNASNGLFPHMRPYLINTEVGEEEGLYIPVDYNVYVLPRDLFKKNGRLMQGAMSNFLKTMTDEFFGQGLNRRIYLIKDECHQATNNLDTLSDDFFTRVINFSATPNLRRGQMPDVQVTDEEAVASRLIKRVELCDDPTIPVDAAIEKLVEVKKQYRNLLNVNPCLIIQISNKDKAEEEWEERIKPALDRHQELKWMKIMDKAKDCDTNDIVKKHLPADKWKNYAKDNASTIDVIVFKMVISEGWDIPRACMLYQVRDTKSRQLDEQVMGRVRRNPRLLDFETLSEEARQLAMTAWVWGMAPESMRRTYAVRLWDSVGIGIPSLVKVKTTRLASLTEKKGFRIEEIVKPRTSPVATDIFSLYHRLAQCDNAIQDLCYGYAGEDVSRWWNFAEQTDRVRKVYDSYICDYSQSMEVDKETSFPLTSSYVDNGNRLGINDWVWRRRTGTSTTFSFDSEAELEWANLLQRIAEKYGERVRVEDIFDDSERVLWGKNFPQNSEIRYEYYADGIHASYPDFVMKDRLGRIHLFEVKSVNISGAGRIDTEEYYAKVNRLKECYRACSALLPDHIFYLPTMKGDEWHIIRLEKGEERTMSAEQMLSSFSS